MVTFDATDALDKGFSYEYRYNIRIEIGFAKQIFFKFKDE